MSIPAEPERYIGRSLQDHADEVAEESVPALLDEVANVRKACMTSDTRVLDFMKPAHTEDTSLTAHVECLQVVLVHFGRGPCLMFIGTISHVQT